MQTIHKTSRHAGRVSRRWRGIAAALLSVGSVVASVVPVSSQSATPGKTAWVDPPKVDLPTTYQKPLTPPADARGAAPNPQLPADEQMWTALTHIVKGQASDKAQLFAAPMFRPGGEEARWQAIDPWLGAGTANGDVAVAPGHVVPVHLGANPGQAVSLSGPSGPIDFGLGGLPLSSATATFDGVSYGGNATASVASRVTRDGVHFDVKRISGSAPATFTVDVADAAHQLGSASVQPDGSIAFSQSLNGAVVSIAAAMTSAAPGGSRRQLTAVTLSTAATKAGTAITIIVPPASGASAASPSTLGIDVGFTSQQHGASGTITLAGDSCTDCALSGSDVLTSATQSDAQDGARVQRGVVTFDTSALPGGAVIDSATLTAHVVGCIAPACGQGGDVEVHALNGPAGARTPASAISAVTGTAPVAVQHVGPSTQSVTWNVLPLVQRWVDGTAKNFGVSLQVGSEQTLSGGFSFAGPQATDAATVPELDVAYHIAPVDEGLGAPVPPNKLTVTTGTTSALVAWTPPAMPPGDPVVSSLVTLTDTDTNVAQTALTHDSSAWFFGLTAGHHVTASVWSQTNGARSDTPATAAATIVTATPSGLVPAAPVAVAASRGTAGVQVRWAPPSAAALAVSRYDVVGYAASGTAVSSQVACGTCTSVVFPTRGAPITSIGISASTNFGTTSVEARVAVDQGQAATSASSVSSSSSVGPVSAQATTAGVAISALPETTGPTVPGAPGSVTGTPGNTTASIAWTAASDGGAAITGYTVQAYTTTGTAVGGAVAVCGTCLTATVTGLANGSSYYATVYATNSVGNGPTAQSANFTLNAPPSVQKYTRTLASDNSIPYSRGVEIGYGVKIFNPQSTSMSVTSVSDWLDSGYVPELNVTLDNTDFTNGPFCTATSSPACTLPGDGTMSIGSFTLAAGANHTFRYFTVVVGSERGCARDRTTASATNAYGTGSDSSQAPILCDAGVGNYPWFTTTSWPTGPQGSLTLNAGDGNALLTQDDSTSVPLHGGLTLGIHRAYNSIALSSASGAGMLGSSWWLTFDDGGVVAQGLTAAGLFVPPDESVARPLPVTAVTAEGGRTVFPLAQLATPIDVTALQAANSTGPLAVTIPRALALDAGYNRLCVDQVAGPPMGVHASLWRYVEANSSNSSCTRTTWTSSAVLGYAVERVDRVRYEFASDGHKLDTQDANANEIRVHYVNDPASAGKAMGNLSSVVEPATGRSLTFTYTTGTPNNELDVTDVAHGVTKYFTNATSGLLVSVTNPDATQLQYVYGGCAGSSSTQLCSASSPMGTSTTTRLTYTPTSSDGVTFLGPAQVASVIDRKGTTTTFAVNTSTGSATVSEPGQNRIYSSFDPFNNAGALNVVDPGSGLTVTQTFFFWDNTYGGACRQPDNLPDHRLCSTVVQNLSGASDTKYTKHRYGAEGQTLRTENCAAMTDFTSRGGGHDCTGAFLDATSGTHAVYVDASGTTATYDDAPSGGGSVSSPNGPGSGGVRWLATTLYAVVDSTQSLPPRGNVAGFTTAQWQAFLTTMSVDNLASVAPNLRGASSVCSVPSTPVGNTGDVCQVVGPSYNGTSSTRSKMTYLPSGEVATRMTPNAVGVHYSDVVLQDGPSDYWPLTDSAGSGLATNPRDPDDYQAPSTAGVVFGVAGPFQDGGTAVALNGTNARLTGYSNYPVPNTLSIEAWINPQVTAQAMAPIVKLGYYGWQGYGTAGLGVSGDATSVQFYLSPSGTPSVLTASGLHLAGSWHHVLGVSDGSNFSIFVDGLKAATTPMAVNCGGSNCIFAPYVATGGASGKWLLGSVAHVAVYRTALTATQVQAHVVAAAVDGSRSTYKYYGDSDKDLSGSTVSGGWLKAEVDPGGNFTAYAYDAAGNRVRAWDPDSTAMHDLPTYPGTIAAPPTGTYTETLHASGAAAYSAPGRYVVSKRDQLGNLTTFTRDADGNALTVRPPRGNQAGTASYDVTQAYDPNDELVCTNQPVEANGSACTASGSRIPGATQTVYDPRGNVTQTTDPVGNATVATLDAADRKTKATWIRGWNYSDSRSPYNGSSFPAPPPANCPVLSASDGPFPAGSIECHVTVTYDGAGNAVAMTDGDGGQTQRSYDPQGHMLSALTERVASPLTWERTDNVYDANGNLLRTCPPSSFANGTTNCATSTSAYDTAATYDVNDHVATSTTCRSSCQSPTLYTSSYTYDADGNRITAKDPRNVTTTTTFDLLDRKTSSSFPRDGTSRTSTWLYSYAGDVLDTTDPSLWMAQTGENITATSYDAAHRKLDVVHGADGWTAAWAGTLSSDGGANLRTRYAYDADSHVVSVLSPQAFATSITSPDTRFQQRQDFDADGRVIAAWVPFSDSADSTRSDPWSSGQCLTGVSGYPSTVAVCVTKYSYDANGRVSSTLLPTAAGNWSSARHVDAAYTADGLQASTTSPNPTGSGTVRTFSFYDATGRTVKTLDGVGTPDATMYSPDGLVTQHSGEPAQTLQNGVWVTSTWHCETMGYDANGNKLSSSKYLDVNQPASGCSNTPLTETWTYSSDNFQMSDTDAGGNVTSWTRDQVGNPIQVMSPSANAADASNSSRTPTVNTYTEDNLLASTTVPVTSDGSQRRQTSFVYTPYAEKASQTVNIVNPTGGVITAGGTQSYTYYPDERLYTTTGRNNETVTQQYDGGGRPTSIVYTVTGQVKSTITASYYLNELPINVSESVPNVAAASYKYSYDGGGSLTYHYTAGYTGHTQTYSQGDAGQVTSSNDGNLGAWSWSYDADGRATHQNNPNGTYTDFGWGSDNVLATVAPYDTGYLGNRCNWTYDSLYRLTFSGCTAAEPFTGSAFNTNDNYGYDNAGRITSYTHGMNSYSGGADLLTFTGTYDHNGNRLSWGSTTAAVDSQRTATYNADSSIRTETIGITQARPGGLQTATYAYAPSGVVQYDGCRNLAYDGFDQMTSAAVAGGNQCGVTNATTFIYDGLHRQVGHTDGPYQLFTAVYHDALSNNLALQQQQWLPNANNRETYYALAPDGTALGDMFGAMPGGFNKSEYFAYDQHRNPIRVTASNGSVVSAPLIDPYGAALNDQLSGTSPQQRSTQASSVGFKGFEQDAGTTTQHLGARDYRPFTGTFGQVDSFVDDPSGVGDRALAGAQRPGMRSLWSFGFGDPVNYWDPSGHSLVCNLGPDCQEMQASSSTGGMGSIASNITAQHAPGFIGESNQEAYGSTTKPPGAVPLPPMPNSNLVHTHLENANPEEPKVDTNPPILTAPNDDWYYKPVRFLAELVGGVDPGPQTTVLFRIKGGSYFKLPEGWNVSRAENDKGWVFRPATSAPGDQREARFMEPDPRYPNGRWAVRSHDGHYVNASGSGAAGREDWHLEIDDHGEPIVKANGPVLDPENLPGKKPPVEGH